MAKLNLKYGKFEISVNGDNDLIEKERTAFYDFIRSLRSVSPDEQTQRQKSEQKPISTWNELKEAADEGHLSELVKSGDRLPLTLKNGERVDLDVGRDERGKTFFIFHHLMKDTHCINEQPNNTSSWRDCDMRQYLNSDICDLLPDEVKEGIVPTHIVQVIDGERVEVWDQLFALSFTQVLVRLVYLNLSQKILK